MSTNGSKWSNIPDGAIIMPIRMPDGTIFKWLKLADGSVVPLQQFIKPEEEPTPSPKPTPDNPPKKQPAGQTCYSARFPNLVDIVEDNGELVYLIVDGNHIKTVSSLSLDNKVAFPPPRDQLPFLIPRWEEVNRAYYEDSPQALFRDLIAYHKQFSQLPREGYYVLLAAWDFSTYILETLNYSGYIYLYAVPERGKTKTGQAMIYVAYRGIHQENLREANLFRASHDLNATLFIDVTNLSKKAYKENSQDIILQRFEKGARVRRVHHPEWGAFKDSRFYDVFGATVIATNEPINEVMESRSFPIDMPYAHKNFPKPLPQQGLLFRERLLAWRAHFMVDKVTLPSSPQFPPGRLADIAAPLWQIIKLASPSHCLQFEDFIDECNENRRQGKSSTIEGEVIKALLELEDKVGDGKIEIDRITDKLNQDRREFHKESSRYVGKVLRRLGFELLRKHGSKRRYYYDIELINNLAVEYGLRYTPVDLMSPTSPTSPQIEKKQLQGDMRGIRDVRTEDAHIPESEKAVPPGANGRKDILLVEYLGDRVYFAMDDSAAQLVPSGCIGYTLEELKQLDGVNDQTKRLVHEAKKLAGARVMPPGRGMQEHPGRLEHPLQSRPEPSPLQ